MITWLAVDTDSRWSHCLVRPVGRQALLVQDTHYNVSPAQLINIFGFLCPQTIVPSLTPQHVPSSPPPHMSRGIHSAVFLILIEIICKLPALNYNLNLAVIKKNRANAVPYKASKLQLKLHKNFKTTNLHLNNNYSHNKRCQQPM